MPIGGFIVNAVPEDLEVAVAFLTAIPEVEIHGHDKGGNIVLVIDAPDSEHMQRVVKKINDCASVLTVGLTYLNVEDEADTIPAGADVTGIFHGGPASGSAG
ncbi:MAG: chaperone NapD [Desulfobulbaceae bacterium]|nr:chaperone NapD [Desulfobulbaceae bacterium]